MCSTCTWRRCRTVEEFSAHPIIQHPVLFLGGQAKLKTVRVLPGRYAIVRCTLAKVVADVQRNDQCRHEFCAFECAVKWQAAGGQPC